MAITRFHAFFIVIPGTMVLSWALLLAAMILAWQSGMLPHHVNNIHIYYIAPAAFFACATIGAHLSTACDDLARDDYID